jgi:nickel-dependent lactate racemase
MYEVIMEYLDISLLYGSDEISHFLPANRGKVKVIDPPKIKSEILDLKTDLINALENPTDSLPLKDLVQQVYPGTGKKVLVLADDNTRPNLHTKLLHPLILNYLIDICSIKKEDLGILIASGTHRPPSEEEIRDRILGDEVFSEYKDQILIHDDQHNLQDLGTSSIGTPITINKDAFEACLLIPITDSEYHYFAGVAGTVKQLFPGVSGRLTTNTNHTRMFDKEFGFKPACRLGNTAGNPIISDMKEMAEKIQKYTSVFCVDAIMDHGEIACLNAGNIISLHNLAKELLYPRRVIPVDEPADLVIVSMGNLDLNLFQAGKGIHAAWNAAKQPGGMVLLLARCADGSGSDGYQETMQAVQHLDLDQALTWVIDNKCSRETFRIGNQKPVDSIRILKTLGENQIKILSDMDADELKKVYRMDPLEDFGSPQENLRQFLDKFLDEKPEALIYILKDSGLYITPKLV